MMLPTVAQAMWNRFFTAVLFISRATHATCASFFLLRRRHALDISAFGLQ